MFHADVAKVDRDVAYVAMVVHVCCKLLFLMFHLFFPHVRCKCVYLDVAYVSYIYCKCFYLDVTYVCNCFSSAFHVCFENISDACLKCFSCFANILSKFFKSR